MVSPFLPWLEVGCQGKEQLRKGRPAEARSAVFTGNLGESVLLPLWLPVPRFHHPGGVLFTNQHRHGILPAVCRGEGKGARKQGVWELGPAWNRLVRLCCELRLVFPWSLPQAMSVGPVCCFLLPAFLSLRLDWGYLPYCIVVWGSALSLIQGW